MIFRQKNSSLQLYLPIAALIFGWWYFAFVNFAQSPHPSFNGDTQALSIDRTRLKRALAGESDLMIALMQEWCKDHRTTSDNLKRCQQLAHLACAQSQASRKLILPQTFLAATILLAIAQPEELLAIPSGLRSQQHLFSVTLTELVPLDSDSLTNEKIFQLSPDITFIGHYSHPRFVENLKKQNIELCVLESPKNYAEVLSTIHQLGALSNHPHEAEILSIFLETALSVIDLEFQKYLEKSSSKSLSRLLYLIDYGQSNLPGQHSLTWQHMDRLIALGAPISNLFSSSENQFPSVIDNETIHSLQVDGLLIAVPPVNHAPCRASKLTAGMINQRVFPIKFIDDSIQQSPTQFIVLAYFDLANALMEMMQP